jgi:hypothetical protein
MGTYKKCRICHKNFNIEREEGIYTPTRINIANTVTRLIEKYTQEPILCEKCKDSDIKREIESRNQLIENDARVAKEKDSELQKLKKNVKEIIKDLFPKIDIDYYLLLVKNLTNSYNINIQGLNYNQFIAYKLYKFMNLNYFPDDNIADGYIKTENIDFDKLKNIKPKIFMNNIDLKWNMIQQVKKQSSYGKYQEDIKDYLKPKSSSKPKSPPKPKSQSPPKPKSQSPPKPKSQSPPKQSAKFLDGKRSKQSPKKDLDPSDPNYDLEMAFRKL